MSVAKIVMSASTMQAIVSDDEGGRFALTLHQGAEEAKQHLLEDVESGKLNFFLMMYPSDSEEEIATTVAEADDWTSIFEAA